MFVHQCYICITLTPNFTFISHNISFREDKKSEKKYFPNVALKMVTMTFSGQQYYSFVRFTFFKIIYKINTYLYKLSLYTRYSEISYFQVNCRYSVQNLQSKNRELNFTLSEPIRGNTRLYVNIEEICQEIFLLGNYMVHSNLTLCMPLSQQLKALYCNFLFLSSYYCMAPQGLNYAIYLCNPSTQQGA